MRNAAAKPAHGGLPEAYAAIERFVRAVREPALLEPGEGHFPLQPGTFAVEFRDGRLTIQVWDQTRNLARRVIGLGQEKPGRLELNVVRFGGRQGQVYLLDLARERPDAERHGARLVFREQFRRSLRRQFPDWDLAELSTEPNLEDSLSPAYPRALLKKGALGWAALAAPPEPGASATALTFALIWLDYLRRREHRLSVEGLAIFLPERAARAACLRLVFLNPRAVRFQVFAYSKEGYEERLDPRDCGNLDTKLEAPAAPAPVGPGHLAAWVERLRRLPQVQARRRNDGTLSLHVHGLEFAWVTRTELLFGLERKTAAREANLEEIEQLARGVARLRSPSAPDRDNPLYRMHPEAWLESQARADLERIDASLLPEPVYGQVPAVAGLDRGVMDLLAVDREGRLAVLELKASEDIHLPLQALDYWMRVKWHLDSGEFSQLGYFPGVALRREWPRMLLIAPALQFHPKTEVLLRYFAPGIEVERIGVGSQWRQGLEVMFRMRGAERPL